MKIILAMWAGTVCALLVGAGLYLASAWMTPEPLYKVGWGILYFVGSAAICVLTFITVAYSVEHRLFYRKW